LQKKPQICTTKQKTKMGNNMEINNQVIHPNFYALTNTYESTPVRNWYINRFGSIPNSFISNYRMYTDAFIEKYKDKIIQQDGVISISSGKEITYGAVFEIDANGTIAVLYENRFDKKESKQKGQIYIMYNQTNSHVNYFKKYTEKHKVKEEKRGIINLICKTQSGFELKEYPIKNPAIDFNTNYNKDFKEIDGIVIERLNQEDGKGLVLLYGPPGTGKTSYIRHIINNVTDKRVLYMPPDMASELSNPGLIPFLTDIPNSILIVEDSENVLIKRQGQHNQAISNILNLSDGLLSDCLNIQIVATFNTELKNIDDALLRKGRLIAKYEFKPLSKDRVQNLAKKLGINFTSDSATLAEIYNCSEMDFKEQRNTIGFTLQNKKNKVEDAIKTVRKSGIKVDTGFIDNKTFKFPKNKN